MRFQKRIKILPGITLNLSKSGVSTSIGPKGLKANVGRGRTKVTTGILGTGLSHTETLNSAKEPAAPAKRRVSGWFILFCITLFFGFILLLSK